MKPNDLKILRTIPRYWSHIVTILQQYNLIPITVTPNKGSIKLTTTLHDHHITLADILHTLHLSSQTDLKSVYALRSIYATILPSIPAAILPYLDSRIITAVYPEFLLTPNAAYQVGAKVADLTLIFGITPKQLSADIKRGAITLSLPQKEAYIPQSRKEDPNDT